MSIVGVREYPLYSIFDPESKLVYEIPKYQREYTWKCSHSKGGF